MLPTSLGENRSPSWLGKLLLGIYCKYEAKKNEHISAGATMNIVMALWRCRAAIVLAIYSVHLLPRAK
jgi:hypothetical protein